MINIHIVRTKATPIDGLTVTSHFDDAVILDGRYYTVVVYTDGHAALAPQGVVIALASPPQVRHYKAEQGDVLDVENAGLFRITTEREPGGRVQDVRPALERITRL